MRRRKPKQKLGPEDDSSGWQFQLMPVSEMDRVADYLEKIGLLTQLRGSRQMVFGKNPMRRLVGTTDPAHDFGRRCRPRLDGRNDVRPPTGTIQVAVAILAIGGDQLGG